MKKILKRVSVLVLLIALSSATLFGCDFSFYPKDEVEIIKDNNEYNKPYNTNSLIENIQKKLMITQAFEINGNIEDTSTISLKMIARDTIKNSSFSLELNNSYNLKLNLRNKNLYFKVPLKEMGIESDLKLGIKEYVDDLFIYLPLFANSLNMRMLEDLTKDDYEEIFNKTDFLLYFLDYLLNLGDTSFIIENYQYIINVQTKENLKVVVNKDYSIKSISSDLFTLNFSYPSAGKYILEYPGEIVGISYVTIASIEDTLGESFKDLLS